MWGKTNAQGNGKRSATGSVQGSMGYSFTKNSGTVVADQASLTVSGLTFLPSTIIIKGASYGYTLYKADLNSPGKIIMAKASAYASDTLSGTTWQLVSNAYVNATGFRLPIDANATSTWEAYE